MLGVPTRYAARAAKYADSARSKLTQGVDLVAVVQQRDSDGTIAV